MHKIKAISSAILILLFSLSFGGVWHYCGGVPVDFSLSANSSQVECAMTGCTTKYNPDAASHSYSNNCCMNIHLQLETDNYQISHKPEYNCLEITIFHSLYHTRDIIRPTNEEVHWTYFYKHPPDFLHEVDLNLVQTYLL